MKTLAIRLDEEQHAQLGMIAKLEDLSVTDVIRQAIEQWIEAKRSNPGLQKRAEAVLAEIEHEAATRRGAISALLSGESTLPPTRERPGTGRGRSTKGGGA
jgi:predicted transcriptional regulator